MFLPSTQIAFQEDHKENFLRQIFLQICLGSLSSFTGTYARLIVGLCPANERRRYKVTPSLIGWAQT